MRLSGRPWTRESVVSPGVDANEHHEGRRLQGKRSDCHRGGPETDARVGQAVIRITTTTICGRTSTSSEANTRSSLASSSATSRSGSSMRWAPASKRIYRGTTSHRRRDHALRAVFLLPERRPLAMWRPLGGWRFGNTINGAWAEYLLVPDARANLAPIPDALRDEDVLLCPDIFSTGLSGAESGTSGSAMRLPSSLKARSACARRSSRQRGCVRHHRGRTTTAAGTTASTVSDSPNRLKGGSRASIPAPQRRGYKKIRETGQRPPHEVSVNRVKEHTRKRPREASYALHRRPRPRLDARHRPLPARRRLQEGGHEARRPSRRRSCSSTASRPASVGSTSSR